MHLSDQTTALSLPMTLPGGQVPLALVTLGNSCQSHTLHHGGDSFKHLPDQHLMVVAIPTMAAMGDGESGFESGAGA